MDQQEDPRADPQNLLECPQEGLQKGLEVQPELVCVEIQGEALEGHSNSPLRLFPTARLVARFVDCPCLPWRLKNQACLPSLMSCVSFAQFFLSIVYSTVQYTVYLALCRRASGGQKVDTLVECRHIVLFSIIFDLIFLSITSYRPRESRWVVVK